MLNLRFHLLLSALIHLFSASSAVAASGTRIHVTDMFASPLSSAVAYHLPSAHLQLPPSADEWTTVGITGTDGRFLLDRETSSGLLILSHKGYASRAFDWETPIPGRVYLQEEAIITGTVVDSSGTSVADALIGPILPSEGDEGLLVALPKGSVVHPVWTLTDTTGRFSVPGLYPGFYHFMVNGQETAPQMAAAQTGEETSITLSTRGTTCTGVLLGSRDHLPQPDLWVEAASGVFHLMKLYTRTDREGKFRFPPLPTEFEWTFSTAADRYDKPQTAKIIDQQTTSGERHLQLLHGQGVLITGQMRDADTSAPVSGLRLALSKYRGVDELTTSTDAAGWFRFADVQAFEDLSLRFEDSAYLYRSLAEGRWNQKVLIPTEGEDITSLTLALRKQCEVSGKVVGPGGRPAAGAKVTLRSHRWLEQGYDEIDSRMTYEVAADAAGKFTAFVFPPGPYDLTASTELLSAPPRVIYATTTDSLELVVKVQPLSKITGQVLDPGGTPLIGSRVEMTSFQDDLQTSELPAGRLLKAGTTNDFGQFQLEGAFPTQFHLTAMHALFQATVTTNVLSVTTAPINLQFPEGNVLRVNVIDELSEPVKGATVQVYTSTSSNPSTGSQYLSHPTTEQGDTLFVMDVDLVEKILVRHPDFVPHTATDVGLPNTTFEVRLKRHPSVSVNLIALPGMPQDEVPKIVWLLRARPDKKGYEPLPSYFTAVRHAAAANGKAVFTAVEPGWYKAALSAADETYHSETIAFEVKSELGEITVDLLLATGCSLVGRITDESTGKPLAGAEVSVKLQSATTSEMEIVSRPSASDGSYRIGALPAGMVSITARHPAFPSKAELREIPPSGEVTHNIAFNRHLSTLKGKITLEGKPQPQATIVLYPNEDVAQWTDGGVSEKDGSYQVERLPEGTYLVVVEGLWGNESKALRQRHTVLVRGKETVLNVDFRNLVRLHGVLRMEKEDPEKALALWFTTRDDHTNIRRSLVGVDGRYEILLEPGAYFVALSDGPGISIDVPEGPAKFSMDFDYAPLAQISGLNQSPPPAGE